MAYFNAPYMQPYGGGFYTQSQVQMNQQPQQNGNGILWVQGEAGAKAWAVAPGQSVTLMDSENPALYLKSADQNGIPSMRIFDLVERVKPSAVPAPDMSNYITRKEFDELKAMITGKGTNENGESSV